VRPGGKAPGRYDAVNVWMMDERLSPGVQYTQKADLGPQAFRIGRHFQQGGGHAVEQQVVEYAFVLQHQFGELVRHGEDNVEVFERNQFASARRDPAIARLCLALGTMAVAAGVEGEAEILPAFRATVAVFAEGCRAAALNGPHDLVLRPGEVGASALDVAARPGAEDIGHLQRRRTHDTAGSLPGKLASANVSSGLGASRNFRVTRCR